MGADTRFTDQRNATFPRSRWPSRGKEATVSTFPRVQVNDRVFRLSHLFFSPFFPSFNHVDNRHSNEMDKKIRLKAWKSAEAIIIYQRGVLSTRLEPRAPFFRPVFSNAFHNHRAHSFLFHPFEPEFATK